MHASAIPKALLLSPSGFCKIQLTRTTPSLFDPTISSRVYSLPSTQPNLFFFNLKQVSLTKMVKMEIVNLSSDALAGAPDAPPGFPPKISTTAAAGGGDSSKTQICASRGGGGPYSYGQQWPPNSLRKRSRRQFHAPPPTPQPVVPPPQKAELIPQLPYQEIGTSNVNPLYSTPLTTPQEQIAAQASNDHTLIHMANALHYMGGAQTERLSGVNKNLIDTLKAINRKHGDITKGCSLESGCMRNLVSLGVCKVVQDLQTKQLEDVDMGTLGSYYAAVRDAESMKFNVGWLRDRLDEIRDAIRLSEDGKRLVNEKNRHIESVDSKKKQLLLCRVELERVKCEIRRIELELAQEMVVLEELNEKISARMSKSLKFLNMHLMDGLI